METGKWWLTNCEGTIIVVMATDANPLVSVIIPTYDRPAHLDRAVQSVAAQTYSPIELIIVDDCSPDPVEPLVRGIYDSELHRVLFRRHDENRGGNAARNTGIRAASGTYIAFLDDDDYWRPQKVERQVTTFQQAGSETGVVYTGMKIVGDDGTTIGISNRQLSGDITEALLCGDSIGSFTRLMVQAELFETVGLLDERLPAWQDRDLNIRLSRHCLYESIPEPLAVHRRGTHAQIGDKYADKRDTAYPLFISKHRPVAAEYGEDVLQRFLATQTFSLATSALQNGQNRAARQHLVTALHYHPTYWKAYAYLPFTAGERVYHRVKRLKQRVRQTIEQWLPDTESGDTTCWSPEQRTDRR